MKLGVATTLALLGAMGLIFFYAPVEAEQGIVQKIFYAHVACAITMYFGFLIAFLASLLYVLEKKRHWDEIAVAGAETGFFFCSVVLLTGPFWGKPVWGAWWTWDPRLTTTLLLWLLYAGYLVLRGYFGTAGRGRTLAAVIAILAFLDVPLVHFAVRLWRSLHPTVIGSKGGGIPPTMQLTLGVTFAAMLLLFAALFRARFRLERSRNLLNDLHLELSETP